MDITPLIIKVFSKRNATIISQELFEIEGNGVDEDIAITPLVELLSTQSLAERVMRDEPLVIELSYRTDRFDCPMRLTLSCETSHGSKSLFVNDKTSYVMDIINRSSRLHTERLETSHLATTLSFSDAYNRRVGEST